MKVPNRLSRLLGRIGLAVALIAAAGVPAFSQNPGGLQSDAMSAMHSQMSKLDINSASLDQLKAIPGIGEVYAKKIIAGRPYTTKHQLVTKGILPRNLYEKVKEQIIAHRVKK